MINLLILNKLSDWQIIKLKSLNVDLRLYDEAICIATDFERIDACMQICGYPEEWLVESRDWILQPNGSISRNTRDNLDLALAGLLTDQYWYEVPLGISAGFEMARIGNRKLIQTFREIKGYKPKAVFKDGNAFIGGDSYKAKAANKSIFAKKIGWIVSDMVENISQAI